MWTWRHLAAEVGTSNFKGGTGLHNRPAAGVCLRPWLRRIRKLQKTDSYPLLDVSHCRRYSTCIQVLYSLAALAFMSNSFHIKSFTKIIMPWTLFWALGLTVFGCYLNFLSEILILITALYNKYHLPQPNEEYCDTVKNDSKLCYFWSVSMPLIWRELIKRTISAFLLWHMVSKMSLFFQTYACNESAEEGCIL
jgi:hypothetical protein